MFQWCHEPWAAMNLVKKNSIFQTFRFSYDRNWSSQSYICNRLKLPYLTEAIHCLWRLQSSWSHHHSLSSVSGKVLAHMVVYRVSCHDSAQSLHTDHTSCPLWFVICFYLFLMYIHVFVMQTYDFLKGYIEREMGKRLHLGKKNKR